jgi:VanZ family protein
MDPRRYSLHFLEYFGLGVLLYFALHKSWLSRRALILTLIIGSAIGVSDELFQASIPGRRLNPLDIISNGIGMLLGALTFFAAKYEEILNIGRR